jgi:EAL domain-containing protein (putative c-di-GMP-specific phosphodiesterase class I)
MRHDRGRRKASRRPSIICRELLSSASISHTRRGVAMLDKLYREVFIGGQSVFCAGDVGDCAYLIEEGAVEIVVSEQGREQRIGLLSKGELFGEIALIDRQPRTATVRALERTVLIPIHRKLVEELLEKSDPILRHLLLTILERYRINQNHGATSADVQLTSQRNALKGEATQKLSLAHGITRALAQNEFELYYQPICSLADGRIAGFEALIRWHHPTDGLIPPMDFLWVAEQTGLIHELGLWTLERACRDWPELSRCTDYPVPFVSVNLSAIQLTGATLVDDVRSIIANHRMPPAQLKLELTETVMVEHPEVAQDILKRLMELGSQLALDDYGTGYSGLDHLQRYPIGTLKLDRAFIAPMLDSPQSMEIVRSSIELAHSLGMNVVAEGVETEAVSARLTALGCEFGQGWLFGKPLPLADNIARAQAR